MPVSAPSIIKGLRDVLVLLAVGKAGNTFVIVSSGIDWKMGGVLWEKIFFK